MNTIEEWFKTKDYNTGVEIYANSSAVKTRTLETLKRGKSGRNMTILIKELRAIKNDRTAHLPDNGASLFKQKKDTPKKPQPKPQEPAQHDERLQQKELSRKSTESFFKKIQYGDLPKELRARYRILKDLFYEMNECKFTLNDLPAEDEIKALKLILKIEDLDNKKSLIWRELDHWMHHRTILPVKTETDFSKTPPHLLGVKKANIESSISKISKRIDSWKESLESIKDKKQKIKTEQQINRSEKRLHEHHLNLLQIKNLLHE